MPSKKSAPKNAPPVARSPATFGLPPMDIAQKLAIRYRFRHDGAVIGVPYEVWGELADFYWKAYGFGGIPCSSHDPSISHQLNEKPDALPLHTDGELDSLVPKQQGVAKGIATATVWIYPKV
jgi:hypothetical protein